MDAVTDAQHNAAFHESIALMLATDGDIRGTVASLAREVEDQTNDRTFPAQLNS